MMYGYARVSTKDQKLDRQLEQLKQYINDDRYIITDKASGKDFERMGYNSLVGTDKTAPMLHAGDVLLITSLDRLGRNYMEVKNQWEYITQSLKADIKVLEIPLLDTTSDNNLDKRFIADLVLQILCYTSQKERENTRLRQRQGIDAMRIVDGKRISSKTGRPMGRPEMEYPSDWINVYNRWQNGDITATYAMQILELKRSTFYKLVNKYKSNISPIAQQKRKPIRKVTTGGNNHDANQQ